MGRGQDPGGVGLRAADHLPEAVPAYGEPVGSVAVLNTMVEHTEVRAGKWSRS